MKLQVLLPAIGEGAWKKEPQSRHIKSKMSSWQLRQAKRGVPGQIVACQSCGKGLKRIREVAFRGDMQR